MMILKRFQVTDFRSVDDSGWIETEDVTALVGTNEAGKTNVLLPLWKLRPAKEGEIVPTADFPRKKYSDFRNLKVKPVFIRAQFELDDALVEELSALTGAPVELVRTAEIRRGLAGQYYVVFPEGEPVRTIQRERVVQVLGDAERDLSALTPMKTEEDLKRLLLASLRTAMNALPSDAVDAPALASAVATLEAVKTESAPKTSVIVPRHRQASDEIRALVTAASIPPPGDNEQARSLVVERMPRFVFYSTYGNLDSEIYLPHVIANMERADLGAREQAKVRTLKVLFEFVGLSPIEILELGRDFKDPTNPKRAPTDEEIATIAEKKKQRSILLQSASAKLTQQFRDWWSRGSTGSASKQMATTSESGFRTTRGRRRSSWKVAARGCSGSSASTSCSL